MEFYKPNECITEISNSLSSFLLQQLFIKLGVVAPENVVTEMFSVGKVIHRNLNVSWEQADLPWKERFPLIYTELLITDQDGPKLTVKR